MSNPLIARFAGELLLAEVSAGPRINANLQAVIEHPRFQELASVGEQPDFWQEDGGWCRPYIVKDGVLQIPVKGVLLNNFPYQLWDWATGYEYVWEAFRRGCGDFATGAIKGIALILDTPGGMVAGCFDAVDKMVAIKDQVGVPVRAFAHESAYSAGYAIATVADSIAVSRTGGVGSIGVVTSHLDMSAALEKAGLKLTFIASDPSKVEGNPSEPLAPAAYDRIKARIDELYGIFAAAVLRSRPVTEEALREDLRAYCFTATQAVSNGLADSIGSLEDATAQFVGELDDLSDNDGDEDMTTPVTTVEQAVHEQAVASARAEALAEGAAAAQTRISAILGSDEAEGREDLAKHFAFKSALSAEDALAALAAAPKTAAAPAAEQPANGVDFAGAMDASGNPNVGGNDKNDEAAEAARANGDDVVALIGSVGLSGFRVEQK